MNPAEDINKSDSFDQDALLAAEEEIKVLKMEIKTLRHIIASLPGNIYWKDKNGRYLGCNYNNAKTVGLTHPDDAVGKTIQDILGFESQHAAAVEEIDNEVLLQGKELEMEEHGLDTQKRPAIYLSKKTPLYDQNGEIMGLLGISIDITERKTMEEELRIAKEKAEMANLQKSEFIGNMSHDINTPLSGIIGLAELLTRHVQEKTDLEFAQTILSSSKELQSFFYKCIEIFKLGSDEEDNDETFQLQKLIGRITELYRPMVKVKNLNFHINYDQKIPTRLFGNSNRLYRILLNLLGNAVKFTERGSLTISASLEERHVPDKKIMVKLTITDTGIGMPQDKLNVIFDQFTRLTPTYKKTYEGSGIGLYIVKQYVESMQGKIEVNSQLDKGSQFVVHLPFSLPPDEGKNSTIDATTAIHDKLTALGLNQGKKKAMGGPVKVLLVEDNSITQLIEVTLLTSLGCMVEIAESGEKALTLFAPGKYDLVFMDMGLPGIQGDTVASEIRKLESESGHHVLIIGLTAHVSDDTGKTDLDGTITAAMDIVFSKPISRDHAQKIVDSLKERS